MTSFNQVNEPNVELVGGPMPLAINCVLLRLRVAADEFSALLMPDRTVCIPESVAPAPRHAANRFAIQFDKTHRVLIHELLRRARDNVKIATAEALIAVITEPPTLSRAGELVFRIALNDTELILHVSCLLTPCELHLDEGLHCEAGQFFAAYDTALDYMQDHIEEIETVGFDTSSLRLSMRDWQAYRERMRILDSPE